MSQCNALLEARRAALHGDDVDELLEPKDAPEHQAVRLEMICRIRALIASGRYDTDERLQAALDRLLDSMM